MLKGFRVLISFFSLFLITSLFFPSGEAIAQTTVKITSPADGETITSEQFTVAVAFSFASPGGLVELEIDAEGDERTAERVGVESVTGTAGTVSFLLDARSFYKTGKWYLQARAIGPLKNEGGIWVPDNALDRIAFIYEPVTATSQPSTPPPPPLSTVAPGAIYVQSIPGNAEIWVNGQLWGTTPYGDTAIGFTDLPPGTYSIVVRQEGYQDYTEIVELASDQIYTVRAIMTAGTTGTGWLKITTDPPGARILLNGQEITTSPATLTNVLPGTYDITLKKDGYEDWNDTVGIIAGQITEVNAILPPVEGGVSPVVIGGTVIGVAAAGWIVRKLVKRGTKVSPAKTPAAAGQDYYSEWWQKATPSQRKNWDGFEEFLSKRFGPASLKGYQDVNANPSWVSAYQSFQKEVKAGTFKGTFENWAASQKAGETQTQEMWQRQNQMEDWRPEELVEADQKYGQAMRNLKNQPLINKLENMQYIAAGDEQMVEFLNNAVGRAVDENGVLNEEKVNKMWDVIKGWKVRNQFKPVVPNYSYTDAALDTGYLAGRMTLGALTGGYSEMVFVPISALTTMKASAAAGQSNLSAIASGFKQAGFELATGELLGRGVPRVVKYVAPYVKTAQSAVKSLKLARISPELGNDIAGFQKIVKAADIGKYDRNALINGRQVVKVGKTSTPQLDPLEKQALKIADSHADEIAKNANLLPEEYQQVLGSAKQKVFESAREQATRDVIKKMSEDGIKVKGQKFIGQDTGSHAQPGNPSYNSVLADADHTVNFGQEYNSVYEKSFEEYVKNQGISTETLKGNVYGSGTTGKGAYTGSGMKFVTHYNETTGMDVMTSVGKDGEIVISRFTPQTSNSMLSTVKPEEIPGLKANFQTSFTEKINTAGGLGKTSGSSNITQTVRNIARDPVRLDAVLKDTAKEVSRTAGRHGADSIEFFHRTGAAGYQPPPAAQVADLVKNRGLSLDEAIRQAGYGGNKSQLLLDFTKLLGY